MKDRDRRQRSNLTKKRKNIIGEGTELEVFKSRDIYYVREGEKRLQERQRERSKYGS